MGWGYGVAHDGREIGYGVEATCDLPGCDEQIDRGIGYLCDGQNNDALDVVLDGAEGRSCGKYYCGSHNCLLGEDDRVCGHPR